MDESAFTGDWASSLRADRSSLTLHSYFFSFLRYLSFFFEDLSPLRFFYFF